MAAVQKQNNMKTPFKMKGKSPMMKALIGNQNRLPAELKAKILASPATLKKGATSNARSKTPGPIVADTRVSRKKKTSKSIGPSESPKAIAAKRDKMRSERRKAEKSNPKEFMPETKASRKAEKDYTEARSFAKMKKESMAKMAKKSPAKSKTDAGKRLLKAVPNKKAYDKLSQFEKDSFNKAAKKAGLPTKKVPLKLKKKSPTKQTANRDKPKTLLTDKIKKGAKAVGKVAKKATKKLVTESPGGRLVSKASKYLAKRKKAKTGAKTAGTSAKTVGALAKSNEKAKQEGKAAAEGLSKQKLKATPRAKRMMTKKMKKLPKQPSAKIMSKAGVSSAAELLSEKITRKIIKTEAAKPKLTLNQKNKARKDKQKKFLKK